MKKYPRRICGNSYSHKLEDKLKCGFCGLEVEDSKTVLPIHMYHCQKRKEQQRGKECSCDPDQQYCAKCPIEEPERTIETGDLVSVNSTKAKSSLSRKRMAATSDSLKLKEVKAKRKVAKHQMTGKQSQSLKVENASKVSTEIKCQFGMKPSCESHDAPDKLYKSSLRNTAHQKKKIPATGTEASCEKSKQPLKKSDCLPVKSNPTRKVALKLLLSSIPENNCGMLLQSSSGNNFYKCCRCGKAFKAIRIGSMHYSNCKSTRFLNTVVDVNDIKWLCTICHSPFSDAEKLLNHSKNCNIFTRKYDKACEKRCEKCHYKCISPFGFQNHDCTKVLDSMKACAVRLNPMNINPVVHSIVMHECEFCGKIFDEQLTEQHFRSHHPGERSSGNYKQYLVNMNPGLSSATVVIKTEPVSECSVDESGHYSHVNSRHSSNPDISMPPPSVNLPALQSSARLSNRQPPSAQTGRLSSSHHSASEGARLINQQICKCVNHNVANDTKPCLKCLNKLDITKFSKDFNLLPFRVAEIKQEAFEDTGVLNVNTQVDGNTFPCSSQIGKDFEHRAYETQQFDSNFSIRGAFNFADTPPSSLNGASPPSTPTASTQPHSHVDHFSASDVNMGYSNEDPNPVDIFPYTDDDHSLALPLMHDIPEFNSCEITHIHQREEDNYNMVDAWAVVPSEGNEKPEQYICSECFSFSCLDKDSMLRHLYENHDKKLQYLAMYVVQAESDPPSSSDES